MGTARCEDPERTFLIREMPSMFGMFKSVMMRSNFPPPSTFSAALPSSASATSKPAFFKVNETMSRMVFESSTASIRLAISNHPVSELRLQPELDDSGPEHLRCVGDTERNVCGCSCQCCRDKNLNAGGREAVDGSRINDDGARRQSGPDVVLKLAGRSQVELARQTIPASHQFSRYDGVFVIRH